MLITPTSPDKQTTTVPTNVYGKVVASLLGYQIEDFSETDEESYALVEVPNGCAGNFAVFMTLYTGDVQLMAEGAYEN